MGGCHGLPSAAGSGRATTFVAAAEALSVNLGSALCICSALLCAVAFVVRLGIGVRGRMLPPIDLYAFPRILVSGCPSMSLLTGHSRPDWVSHGVS